MNISRADGEECVIVASACFLRGRGIGMTEKLPAKTLDPEGFLSFVFWIPKFFVSSFWRETLTHHIIDHSLHPQHRYQAMVRQ